MLYLFYPNFLFIPLNSTVDNIGVYYELWN